MSVCQFVRGTVEDASTHTPLEGATVELWFVKSRRRTLIGKVEKTGPGGGFLFDVRAAANQHAVSGSGRCELQVTRGGVTLKIEGGTWRWFYGTDPGVVKLCVEVLEECVPAAPMPVGTPDADVWGQVLHHDGTPAVGVYVRAHDFQIDGESDPLTDAFDTTDSAGWYAFDLPALGSGAPQRNVLVKALTASTGGRLLATSAPQFGRTATMRIDVKICDASFRSPSEWAQNHPPLNTALGSTLYTAIGPTQLLFLSASTGVSMERVQWWVNAHLLHRRIDPTAADLEVAEAFYGLQYAGLPADLRVLHERGQARVQAGLTLAWRDNIIGTDASLLFESLYASISSWRAAQIASTTNPYSLHALFSCSPTLTSTQVDQIVAFYGSYTGARTAFWSSVEADLWPTDATAVAEARRIVALAGLAFSHVPTVDAIVGVISTSAASTTAALAYTDWQTIVGTIADVQLPTGLDGDTLTAQRDNYATLLMNNALGAFPSAAFRAGILDALTTGSSLYDFVVANGGYDFDRSDILASGWTILDEDQLVAVARFQRLYRIAPSASAYATVAAMEAAGMTSAHGITRMGSKRAVDQLVAGGVSDSDARLTVAKAAQQSAKALALFTQGHANLSGVKGSNGTATWPELKGIYSRFLPSEEVDSAGVPSWEELFGNVDFCTCEDCKSITGPAAYLVDLLNWLNEREGWSGAGHLQTRRPDLGLIKLDCNNTTRALPYIDLVLEVLENAVALNQSPAWDTTQPYTTDAEGPELLASPQYVNHPVYGLLGTLDRPISLPFDRPLEEARTFLRHLGVSRPELMEAFADGTTPSNGEIAQERLGLFAGAAEAITVWWTSDEPGRWNLSDTITDTNKLAAVSDVLERAEITYVELLDLLHTHFVNARTLPTIDGDTYVNYTDACDLDAYALRHLRSDIPTTADWAAVFGRFRRFLRLRRATGWSFRDLDAVLTALVTTVDDDAALTTLGDVLRLVEETGLSPREVAAWFGDIDIWGDRATAEAPVVSLYDTVFLNPAVFPVNDRTDTTSKASLFVIGSTGEPAGATGTLDGVETELQALLGVDQESYTALLTRVVSTDMTRANLTTLYKWVSLSRVLGLSVSDTIALADLWSLPPFSAAEPPFGSPTSAVRFVREARGLLASGLTVQGVRYLVEHDAQAAARLTPTEGWFQDVVGRLADKLTSHFDATPPPASDPSQALLGTFLDEVVQGTASVDHPTNSSATGVTRTMIEEAIAGTLSTSVPSGWGTLTYEEYVQLVLEAGLFGLCDSAEAVAELATLAAPTSVPETIAARQLWTVRLLVRGGDAKAALQTPSVDPEQVVLGELLDEILPVGATARHPTISPSLEVTRGNVDDAIAGTLTSTLPPGIPTYPAFLQSVFEAALEGRADLHDFATRLSAITEPLADAATIEARQLWAAQRLLQWKAAQALVKTHFSEAHALPEPVLEALRADTFSYVDSGMDTPSGGFADWVNLWLHPEFRAAGLSAASPADITDATRLGFAAILAKIQLTVQVVGLDEDEAVFWAEASTSWGFLRPYDLRPEALADEIAGYGGLKLLADLARLRARLPGSSPHLAEILATVDVTWDSSTTPNLCAAIAERTGWLDTDLTSIVDDIGLGTPSSRTRLALLHQLLDAIGMVRRVGASAETVNGWRATIDATAANQVVMAARSRYATPAAWSAVARPLRDQLRKKQRDALVAYLINHTAGTFTEVEDLYDHYLIDVLMNPEMLTARIKQATCSVQLYIQRNMVGIEDEVTFNEDDRNEWEWMKNYRVWEAARKVFLYPENWIEPELRDDKTPFFETLENELAQGDITDARAEDAALAYLDRLNELAHVEVLAYYVQRETIEDAVGVEETIDVLHVFARTRGQNPTYWYRRWEDQSTWTPWEKIECGVEGRTLAPVVFERRLLLFWFMLDDTGSDEEDADPSKWYEIRLAWSEYRDGKWQPKNEAEETLVLENVWAGSAAIASGRRHASDYAKKNFHFMSSQSDDGIELTGMCWNPGLQQWYEIGTFEMDPCTRTVSATPVDNSVDNILDPSIDPEIWDDALRTYWNALSADERVEMIGADKEYLDLNEAELVLLETHYRNLMSDIGVFGMAVPVHVDRLARVEGIFSWIGYDGYTDEGGGDHLTIWAGSSRENLDSAGVDATSVKLLGSIGLSSVVLPSQSRNFVSQVPFFVDTGKRSYLVVKEVPSTSDAVTTDEEVMDTLDGVGFRALDGRASSQGEGYVVSATSVDANGLYRFDNFFHPYVCSFIKEARRDGIADLLDPSEIGSAADLSRQQLEGDHDLFQDTHAPTTYVKTPYPFDDIDFEQSGAYAAYNWELFFHLPLYVANRLTDAQRFEDALKWYSFIFDPLARAEVSTAWSSAPERFWKVKPFLEPVSAPVTEWLEFTGATGDSDQADAFERQVEEWRDDPFNPHLLARLRKGTYQKAVVMKYLENLIAWGDNLFTRDTIESINEATQYYILAGQILGDRPEKLTKPEAVVSKNFNELLDDGLDAFSESVVTSPVVWLETVLRSGRWDPLSTRGKIGSLRLRSKERAPSVGTDTYFCIPPNPKLLGYWDTVEDRLFKIRNSLNIEGVFRTLPLYEPPIDPALLVRASAMGVSLGTVLADLDTPLPYHRFSVMHQRAQALAGSVKALGGALLSAIEKRDAEALALLRQGHEITLLDLVRTSKEKAIEEAQANLAATSKRRITVETRRNYYDNLINKGWLAEETASAVLQQVATGLETIGGVVSFLSGVLGTVPDLYIGTLAGTKAGGDQFHRGMSGIASGFSALSALSRGQSGYLATTAGYKRREQDWKTQKRLAEKELVEIDKQILAAEIREAIARHELKVHDKQAKQSDEIRSWMEAKFTNKQLYDWMVSQVSATYYASYQLAYKAAKRAQRAYNHELGRNDTLLSGVYWNSTVRGLLAGEQLGYDLERMDVAYLENDRREFELTKHVALSRLDPLALARLREQGECYFAIPETSFDLDAPGHYFRRIQSVGLSIAAVTGQHGTVNAKLTLHAGSIRTTPDADVELVSDGFNDYPSIVTSIATQDSGLFQTDLRDPRYLPFERRGAISQWHLKLTAQVVKQIDWESITDVVLHMRYTARDGGAAFESDQVGNLASLASLTFGYPSDTFSAQSGGAVFLLSARRDDPDNWYVARQASSLSFEMEVTDAMLGPLSGRMLAGVIVIPTVDGPTAATLDEPQVTTTSGTFDLVENTAISGAKFYAATHAAVAPSPRTYTITDTDTDPSTVDDLLVVLVLA